MSSVSYDNVNDQLLLATASSDHLDSDMNITNIESQSSAAILEKIVLTNNQLPNNFDQQNHSNRKSLSSYVSTDVKVDGDFTYVVSGNGGKLYVLSSNNLSLVSSTSFDDARAVEFDANNI